MKTLFIEENWDESVDTTAAVKEEWILTDLDKLCFNCPLDDCKENSKKCLINVAKNKK